MTHIEAIESRQLMAAAGLDATFGSGGALTLPTGVAAGNAIVSFPGGYIVEAQFKKADYLYKLTDAGQIDTAWGNNGRIATPAFGVDALVYDKKYNLLYAAGVTKRYTNGTTTAAGNVATLRIERFNGLTGAVDTGFADAGVASFEYGKTNTTVENQITIGKLLPLAQRGLAVAYDHHSYQTTGDYFASGLRSNEITVLKFNADGTRNSRFGRRGVGTATTGTHDYQYGYLQDTETFNEPAFGDLQARSDGSLRLLTVLNRGTASHTNDDEGLRTVKSVTDVQSQVFTASGKLDKSQQHAWQVAKTSPSDAVEIVSGEYQSLLVQAKGDDEVIAIGTRVTSRDPDNSFVNTTEAITLSPTAKPVYTTLKLSDRFFSTILPYGNGYYAVEDYTTQIWSTKLRSDFRIVPTYNGGEELITLIPRSDAYATAVDIDGRLMSLHGNHIYRITG